MARTWWQFGGRLSAVALIGLATVVAQAADDHQQADTQVEAGEAEASPDAAATPAAAPVDVLQGTLVPIPLPDYWLGIEVSPASDAICSQLGLEAGQGLVVERVVEGGPAAKCGIRQYDVVIGANGTNFSAPADLVKTLVQARDQEIEFQVLRSGEKQTVKVKPEKRPEPNAEQAARLGLRGDNGKALELLREQLGNARTPLRLQFFHPGLLLPPGALTASIPDDLHLLIDKQGNKPAKIVVERGDQRWETTEDNLAKLPDDIRPHVEAILGRMPTPKFDVEVDPATGAVPPGAAFRPELTERVEKRLEELNRRMEQMRQQIEQLRGDRKGAASDE